MDGICFIARGLANPTCMGAVLGTPRGSAHPSGGTALNPPNLKTPGRDETDEAANGPELKRAKREKDNAEERRQRQEGPVEKENRARVAT